MILDKLRAATAELHKDLEQETIMSSLTTDEISKPKYIEILKRFYSFFAPLEDKLQRLAVKDFLLDFPERRKALLLKNDLEYLQGDGFVENCNNLPALDNMNHAFGILYVMEGSTLGGVMISKMLKTELQIDETSGGSFFYGYGKLTGKRWKDFLSSLNAYSELREVNHEEIIEGAVSTFSKLKTHLSKN